MTETEQLLFTPAWFYRVKKCIKPHICGICGTTIPIASSYFYSKDADPKTGRYTQWCLDCADQRFGLTDSPVPEKALDTPNPLALK